MLPQTRIIGQASKKNQSNICKDVDIVSLELKSIRAHFAGKKSLINYKILRTEGLLIMSRFYSYTVLAGQFRSWTSSSVSSV